MGIILSGEKGENSFKDSLHYHFMQKRFLCEFTKYFKIEIFDEADISPNILKLNVLMKLTCYKIFFYIYNNDFAWK